jgi:hypothetical protein
MNYKLKDILKELNLLREGWMEDLSSKYNEDILIFVGHLLTRAFPDEDISNHPMAEWIASGIKSFGEDLNSWSDSKKKNIENSFETVFNYIKKVEDSDKEIETIKKLNPKQTLHYIKLKEEGLNSKKGDEALEVLKEFEKKGHIKIEKISSRDMIWIKVENPSFFDERCESGEKYGVECQTQTPRRFVSSKSSTYSLMGRMKSKKGEYFDTLLSISTKTNDRFYEIKQKSNKQPGSQDIKPYDGDRILNETIDFITSHPILKNISLFVEFFETNSIENIDAKFGGIGAFVYWLKEEVGAIQRLVESNPKIIDDMGSVISRVKPEFLELLKLDIEDFFKKNPEKVFENLNLYYSVKKDGILNILKTLNYKDFMDMYGEDLINKNVFNLIDWLSMEEFLDSVYPHIDLGKILKQNPISKTKDLIKNIRNKFDKLNDFSKILEKLLPDFIEGMGGGMKAFAKIFNMLNYPRLEKHQNFKRLSDGSLIARFIETLNNGETREVEKEVKEDEQILGKKQTKKLLQSNQEMIEEFLEGDKKQKKVQFSRLLIMNMSEQEKNSFLKKNKEVFLNHFKDEYDKGKINLPPYFMLNLMKNSKVLPNSIDSFDNTIRTYIFDKKELKNNKELQSEILKYYRDKSNSKNPIKKIIDSLMSYLINALNSGFSSPECNEMLFNKFNPIKMFKGNLEYDDFHYYINLIIDNFCNNPRFSLDKNMFQQFLNSEEVNNFVLNQSKNFMSTASERFKDLKSKALNCSKESLEEQKIRKYIRNLLEENFIYEK